MQDNRPAPTMTQLAELGALRRSIKEIKLLRYGALHPAAVVAYDGIIEYLETKLAALEAEIK